SKTRSAPASDSTFAAMPPPAPDPTMQTSYVFGWRMTCIVHLVSRILTLGHVGWVGQIGWLGRVAWVRWGGEWPDLRDLPDLSDLRDLSDLLPAARPRGRRTRTNGQGMGQGDRFGRDRVAVQDLQQQPHGALADRAHGLGDGRQRGIDAAGKPDVVEADEGQVERHAQTPALGRLHDAHCHLVVEAEDRRRRFAPAQEPFGAGRAR